MVMPRSRSMSIEFEHLLLHLARVEPAGELDQPVGQRRLAVVDMRDDGEVADIVDGNSRHGGEITLESAAFKPKRRKWGCLMANDGLAEGDLRALVATMQARIAELERGLAANRGIEALFRKARNASAR